MQVTINPFSNSDIYIGQYRATLASRYGTLYSEFIRTPHSASATGRIGDSIFLVFDDKDRIELIEIANPLDVVDFDINLPFPLYYAEFSDYIKSVAHRMPEEGLYVIDQMGVVVSFGSYEDASVAQTLSIARPGYFDYL